MVSKWIAWARVIRVKFFSAGIPPAILGAAVSWYLARRFDSCIFLLTLLGLIFAMVGCYTFNEYFDFKSSVDVIVKKEDITPYSAGSRVLPEGLIPPPLVFKAGAISWFLAFAVGGYLTLTRGLLVIPFALAGFLTGALYTAPPFKWAYRGVGEAMIGLTFGPLITLGNCYVQLMELPFESVIASLVPGLLIIAVIWINEFPDFLADKEVGKKNLVVRMGRKRAVNVYIFLVTTAYFVVVSAILLGLFPSTTLIALSTLPLAYKNITILKKKYERAQELAPAMAGTILLFVSTTLLLSMGYILATII